MSTTEDKAQEAERQYDGYDFENSAAWQAFRRAALVVSSADAVEAEQRLRRVFFRKHVNASLPRNENSGARASAGRSTSTDRASTSPQPPARAPERLVEWRRQLIDAVRSWQARTSLSGAVVLMVQVLDALTVFLALLAALDSSGRWYVHCLRAASVASIMVMSERYQHTAHTLSWYVRLQHALACGEAEQFWHASSWMHARPLWMTRVAVVPSAIAALQRLALQQQRPGQSTMGILSALQRARERLGERLRRETPRLQVRKALIEIYLLAALIVLAFTRHRQLLLLFTYYRYVQLRYQRSLDARQAWGVVGFFTDGLAHRLPPEWQASYAQLRAGVVRLGQPTHASPPPSTRTQ